MAFLYLGNRWDGRVSSFLYQQVLEAGWIGCFKFHLFSGDGMIEAELECMERQTADGVEVFDAITSVTNDGVSQVLHVDAYLVLSPCFKMQFDE